MKRDFCKSPNGLSVSTNFCKLWHCVFHYVRITTFGWQMEDIKTLTHFLYEHFLLVNNNNNANNNNNNNTTSLLIIFNVNFARRLFFSHAQTL